eukprot:CAMPEP_0168349098 /NCGR_PEP_ID=MMETSP0213-20121227/20191_1 /TAXON_ID=151035 /ORGANISM="Euplotes harpa, Strain FSP1.4" /LENGTH=110 /DNA_ID=CAMNT_0008358929 /DNA_START=282 /DNA_END=615 /DNA_ORIENTATION=+
MRWTSKKAVPQFLPEPDLQTVFVAIASHDHAVLPPLPPADWPSQASHPFDPAISADLPHPLRRDSQQEEGRQRRAGEGCEEAAGQEELRNDRQEDEEDSQEQSAVYPQGR